MRRSLHRTTYMTLVVLAVAQALAPPRGLPRLDRTVALSQGSFLGVQQAVEIAVKNHPMLLEGAANLKASEARTEQARSLYYPQVYANANTVAGAGVSNPGSLSAADCCGKTNPPFYRRRDRQPTHLRFRVHQQLDRVEQTGRTRAGAGCQREARAGAAVRATRLSDQS